MTVGRACAMNTSPVARKTYRSAKGRSGPRDQQATPRFRGFVDSAHQVEGGEHGCKALRLKAASPHAVQLLDGELDALVDLALVCDGPETVEHAEGGAGTICVRRCLTINIETMGHGRQAL